MPETERLSGRTAWIDVSFVERDRTPRWAIEVGICCHAAGMSLREVGNSPEESWIGRSHIAVHNWVQKADLQPADGENPDRVAVDQKAIRINDDQYWLYAAVDPETNRILHSQLFPMYTIPIARDVTSTIEPILAIRLFSIWIQFRSAELTCSGNTRWEANDCTRRDTSLQEPQGVRPPYDEG